MDRGSQEGELDDSNLSESDLVWLGNWFAAFQEEQQNQTRYLRNISTFTSIMGFLIIISIGIGIIAGFFGTLLGF